MIFKTVEVKEHQPYSVSPGTQTPTSSKAVPETVKTQTFVDERKPKPKPDNQWKAPWLNVQRNKQRQGSSDNVIRPQTAVPAQKYHDAASILKHKLDAKTFSEPDAKPATEVLSTRSDTLHKSLSGMLRNC